MREEDRKKLVDLISQRVLAAMRASARGSSHAPGSSAGSSSGSGGSTVGHSDVAKVRPPVGQCTGDYSKFKDVVVKDHCSCDGDPGACSCDAQMVALSGIVTASQLQAAMDSSPDGVAVVARDARLTPLANDLVRQDSGKVRRADGVQSVVGGGVAEQSGWLYWIDGKNAAAQVVVSKRRGRLRALSAAGHSSSIGAAVRELADAIRNKQVAGGVLFVQSAAKAASYANRCSAIRAVVGTCGEAVEQGIAELGANVLIIEYPHQGPRAMEAMVDRIMEQSPMVDASVQRELAELYRHS